DLASLTERPHHRKSLLYPVSSTDNHYSDLIQRECARFEHDNISPTSTLIYSPTYSTRLSMSSGAPTSPLPETPHGAEFVLPLRLRPTTDSRPTSRFSDVSVHSPSSKSCLTVSIRDSAHS